MTVHEQVAAVPLAVLAGLHRRLVVLYAGLAESGPAGPVETMRWTLDELTTVLRYIRAVRQGESADLPRVTWESAS